MIEIIPSHQDILEQYKEVSASLNHAIFALLLYIGFCFSIILQPDVPFVITNSGFEIPVIKTSVSVYGFLIIAPLLLFCFLIYLHIIYCKFLSVEKAIDKVHITSIFSYNFLFAFFIIYFLPTILMLGLTWKASVNNDFKIFILIDCCIIVVGNIFLMFREHKNKFNYIVIYSYLLLLTASFVLVFCFKPYNEMLHLTEDKLYAPYIENPMPELEITEKNSGPIVRRLNLKNADLSHKWINGVSLKYADMSFSNLYKAEFYTPKIYSIDMIGADLTGANLKSSTFFNVRLSYGTLNYSAISDITFEKVMLLKAQMIQVIAKNATLKTVDMEGVYLFSAELDDSSFSDCRFNHSIIDRTRFINSTFYRCGFNGTNGEYSFFTNSKLNAVTFEPNPEMDEKNNWVERKTELFEPNFDNSILNDVKFNEASIVSSSFKGACMTNVGFKNSDLSDADFSNSTIEDADFSNAIFGDDIKFKNAILRNVIFCGVRNIKANALCEAKEINNIKVDLAIEVDLNNICPEKLHK